MTSHLTYNVFRSILRNQALTHAILNGRPLLQRQAALRGKQSRVRWLSGRSKWFTFGRSKEQKPSYESGYEPGYAVLVELEARLRSSTRPQNFAEVYEAIQAFLQHKSRRRLPILDTQVRQLAIGISRLRQLAGAQQRAVLTHAEIDAALQAMSWTQIRPSQRDAYLDLAEKLHDELMLPDQTTTVQKEPGDLQAWQIFVSYLRIVYRCSGPAKAMAQLKDWLRRDPAQGKQLLFWECALRIFGEPKNADPTLLLAMISLMEQHGIAVGVRLQEKVIESLVAASGSSNIDSEIWRWYERSLTRSQYPSVDTHRRILEYCIETQQLQRGHKTVKALLAGDLSKAAMGVVLRWTFAARCSVDDVEKMLNTLRDQSHMDALDMDCLEGLIELVPRGSKGDVQEKLLDLGSRWNLASTAQTSIRRMSHCLTKGDLLGAQAAYKEVQSHDANPDVLGPILNRAVQVHCHLAPSDVPAIVQYARDLVEQNLRLEPETIQALAIFHLQHEQSAEAANLLETHIPRVGGDDRTNMLRAMLRMASDPSTPTDLAWNVYCLTNAVFPHIKIEARLKLMRLFFQRGRSDMAMHVFGHMRQASDSSLRPDAAAYAACFDGIAAARDAKAAQLVNNMLKLDVEVEPDTLLRNALMKVWLACNEPSRALQIWRDISLSREGPNNDSISLALQACQTFPSGDTIAQKIWQKLRQHNISMPKEIHETYVELLDRHGHYDAARQIVLDLHTNTGEVPDARTLLALCANVSDQEERQVMNDWAQLVFPEAFAALEELQKKAREQYAAEALAKERTTKTLPTGEGSDVPQPDVRTEGSDEVAAQAIEADALRIKDAAR